MTSITATVLETALEKELTEHLSHEKHQTPTVENGNIGNGTRPKTVLTDTTGEGEDRGPAGPRSPRSNR